MRGAATEQLYVEEHGEGEPLLLIEGLGQSMWAWREQVPVFAHRYRTIAYDTRGTGRSPVPDAPYGIDELAHDAADILDGRQAHVVGLKPSSCVPLKSRRLSDAQRLLAAGVLMWARTLQRPCPHG